MDFPVLTALIVMPALGALFVLFTPRSRPEIARAIGYAASVATLGMSGYLLDRFVNVAGYQLVDSNVWMSTLGVSWSVGIDGISLFMVVLTAILIPIGLLASNEIENAKLFTFWMLLLESALIGVFVSLDLIMFFVFFEVVLVPMYFLIAGWGHENRRYAATKFFIFTMAGSAFLFAGILSVGYLYSRAHGGDLTFDVETLTAWTSAEGSLSTETARLLFLAFAVAFAVKIPLVPLHTWLPDAHTDAPTAGSVVLAGVLLKMGTYGFLRFAVPMFPEAAVDLAPILLVAAVVGITYGAIVAAMQPNLKRIVAYSSVAHLGFVVLGTFAFTVEGIQGGLFTMLSHGLTTGALFLLVGMLYDRRHTYEIAEYRGVWKAMPVFGGLFVAAAFASIGLPGFSGFVGEFLALLGAFLTSRWYAVVAASGVILAAVYLLWAVQRTMTGEPDDKNAAMHDLKVRELCTVVPLLGLSLFLGFYPQPVLERVEPTVDTLVEHVQNNSDLEIPEPVVAEPAEAEEHE